MIHCSRTLRSGGATPAFFVVLAFCAAAFAAAQTPSRNEEKKAPPRRIRFSGFNWTVKSSDQLVGPGPNFFSDSSENVWVDNHGHLHMRISYRDGRWWAAEVICECSPGFGTYSFGIPPETVRDLDFNAVLGLFNWSDDAAFAHREIDCELSNWGQQRNPTGNAQFVVQPYDEPGHTSRFILRSDKSAVLKYSWFENAIVFTALSDGISRPQHTFEFRGAVPASGGAPRMNLWLLNGQTPSSGVDVHIVVTSFVFQRY